MLLWIAARKQLITIDDRLRQSVGKLALAGVALALAIFAGERVVAGLLPSSSALHAETTLALIGLIGAAVYSAVVLALFGRRWLAAFRGRAD